MNNKLNPGDLALVVGCNKNPVDIGKCVELVEMLAPGQRSAWLYPGTGWPVISSCPVPVWLVISESVTSSDGYSGFTLVAPEHLRPLRGDREPVRQDEREMVV